MKTSTKTVISINNISKVYEGPPPVRALDGVSLEIKEGDFVSIVGQSGSGKSTFLNMIGLLDIKLPATYRSDYLKIINDVYEPKKRREEVLDINFAPASLILSPPKAIISNLIFLFSELFFKAFINKLPCKSPETSPVLINNLII